MVPEDPGNPLVPIVSNQSSSTGSSSSSSHHISPFLSSSYSTSVSSYGDVSSPDLPANPYSRGLPASPYVKDKADGMERGRSDTIQHPRPLQLPEASLKELVPPENFACVDTEGRIYRSGWIEEENLPFIETLGLKTVVSMVFEPYTSSHIDFCTTSNITRHTFGIKGHKVPQGDIPVRAIQSALAIILDRRNHPVLIHCNGGKHRTGCVIGCLRRLEDWSEADIMEEYRRFSTPKSRPADESFIRDFIFSPVWTTLREQQGDGLEWFPEWSSLRKVREVEAERFKEEEDGGSTPEAAEAVAEETGVEGNGVVEEKKMGEQMGLCVGVNGNGKVPEKAD